VLFHEAMMKLLTGTYAEKFARFERAAAKGHEEAIWIVSVVKDVAMEQSAWKEAFAKTEKPLGWYLAGKFSSGWEQFDFFKKSAEGGCSWGQVGYGDYFRYGWNVEKDQKVYFELLEKAANQKNPDAMYWLGNWFGDEDEGDDEEKAVSYYRASAELGWKDSMFALAILLNNGEGCAKDLRQAVIWDAKGGSYLFRNMLRDARRALESGATEALGCDFNQLCYSIGWGLYWYIYDSEEWNKQSGENKAFGNRCLDYYCSCAELQQKSIFAFLLFWNRTVGVKPPGQRIAQLVLEERKDNLVKVFEESDGEEPEMIGDKLLIEIGGLPVPVYVVPDPRSEQATVKPQSKATNKPPLSREEREASFLVTVKAPATNNKKKKSQKKKKKKK
jgi:hypothetical protein